MNMKNDIQLLKTLEVPQITEFVGLLEKEVRPRLVSRADGYAPGRVEAWLGFRPNLTGKEAFVEKSTEG